MSQINCAIGKDVVPASFKGVMFYCTEADIEGGRRGAEGEFPFGENTAYADLGRKIRNYKLTAVFREDDHVSNSQALFMACESPGPGMLVHPTRGVVRVACKSCKIKDDLEDKAGESTADLEFVEANDSGSGIGGFLFGIISTALLAVSGASFLRDYRPARVSQPWRTDIVTTTQTLLKAVARTAARSLPATATTQQWRDQLSIETVAQDPVLASIGAVVDQALVQGFSIVTANVSDPAVKFKTMKSLANIASKSSTLPAGTAAESEEAVLSRHRVLAAVGMAEAAMGQNYPHVEAALTAMDQVLAVLDDEAQAAYATCDNSLYLELRKYATQFNAMMNELAYRLPGLILVDFMGGVHPLVAAYAIYKDAKRHRDLEPRNIVDANGRFRSPVLGIAPSPVA